MSWLIFAAAVWFFIIVNLPKRELKNFWSAGLWTALIGYFLNELFVKNGFYIYREMVYPISEIPLLYLIAVAGSGIILIKYLPEEKLWQLLYLALWSAGLAGLEMLAVERGLIVYLQWSLYYSFFFKLIAFIVVAWLSSITVTRERGLLFR